MWVQDCRIWCQSINVEPILNTIHVQLANTGLFCKHHRYYSTAKTYKHQASSIYRGLLRSQDSKFCMQCCKRQHRGISEKPWLVWRQALLSPRCSHMYAPWLGNIVLSRTEERFSLYFTAILSHTKKAFLSGITHHSWQAEKKIPYFPPRLVTFQAWKSFPSQLVMNGMSVPK